MNCKPHEHEKDLSGYRLSMSREMIDVAENEMLRESYKTANNRAYYAIFHALRAVLSLDGVDFKHHITVL